MTIEKAGAPQTVGDASGDEEGAKPQERTFTQAEVDSIRSGTEEQLAAATQRVAQMALQKEIDQAQATESVAQAKDAEAVADGEISAAEATQRRQTRQRDVVQDFARKRQRTQEQSEHQQLSTEVNALYRVRAANIMAEEHGIDSSLLLNDDSLTDAKSMENKARSLSLDKREAEVKGTETFASGVTGRTSSAVDQMSPQEKIRWGIEHPVKRKE